MSFNVVFFAFTSSLAENFVQIIRYKFMLKHDSSVLKKNSTVCAGVNENYETVLLSMKIIVFNFRKLVFRFL